MHNICNEVIYMTMKRILLTLFSICAIHNAPMHANNINTIYNTIKNGISTTLNGANTAFNWCIGRYQVKKAQLEEVENQLNNGIINADAICAIDAKFLINCSNNMQDRISNVIKNITSIIDKKYSSVDDLINFTLVCHTHNKQRHTLNAETYSNVITSLEKINNWITNNNIDVINDNIKDKITKLRKAIIICKQEQAINSQQPQPTIPCPKHTKTVCDNIKHFVKSPAGIMMPFIAWFGYHLYQAYYQQ